MNDKSFEDVLASVEAAALTNIDELTSDRIEALAGGRGMVNLSLFTITNVITEELLRGGSVEVKFANARSLPVDELMAKAIQGAKASGCDSANAALLTASIMYLAGARAQVGIPAGNRKLGATARMLAGVDRCGVSAVPTSKMNSKVSGFAAVQAIYRAMENNELSPINGVNIPRGVAGVLYGHSALGEDYIWPDVAKNGARIGTQAMLDAMHGTGIAGNAFQAAVLGAAAILEIIHPDAEVPESEGTYGRTSSAYLVGKSAAETAGLPKKLHMRVTNEEYDTAQLVGDIGLILKDVGGPSVVGMMAFVEIFSCFKERLCGGSGSPHNSPLGHMSCYVIPAMRSLAAGGDPEEIGAKIVEDRRGDTVNPDSSILSIYIVSRKASELRNGPVTRLLMQATLPLVARTISDQVRLTYDSLKAGKTLGEVVKELDDMRVAAVEKYSGIWWEKQTGEKVTIKFTKIANAARRNSKLVKKYLAFDPLINVDITVNEKHVCFEHFVDDVLPKVSMGQYQDKAWAIPYLTSPVSDLLLSGCNILNVVIPVSVAAILDYAEPAEAAAEAEKAAYITAGIPGPKASATRLSKIALTVSKAMA